MPVPARRLAPHRLARHRLALPGPGLATREATVLLFLAASAWVATLILARGMAGMTGTMGLGLAAFVPVWTLMMAAMMLPSVTPTAWLYARTVQSNRAVRIAGLGLAALVLIEKTVPWGPAVSQLAGAAALALAVATIWAPGSRPGCTPRAEAPDRA